MPPSTGQIMSERETSLLVPDDDHLEQIDPDCPVPGGEASLTASVLNLCNTTIGAGVIAIPFFFGQCGWALGTCILLVISALSAYASWLLVVASAAQPKAAWTYQGLAESTYSRSGVVLLKVVILALTIGVLSAFFVQLGETASDEINLLVSDDRQGEWWTTSAWWKLVFTVAVLLPLGMFRTLSGLAGASLLVFVLVWYVIAVVCALEAGDTGDGEGNTTTEDVDVRAATFGDDFFQAIPIAILAFGNQLNVHQVIGEMQRPTYARIRSVLITTNVLTTIVYLGIGLAGYLRFGSAVTDNVLLSPYGGLSGAEDNALTAARFVLIAVVLFSYPMLLMPCRACLHTVITEILPRRWTEDACHPNVLFVLETCAIIGLTFLISVVVPVLGTIMGYTGAIAGSLLGFVFPGFYNWRSVHSYRGVALGGFGVVAGLVCFSAQVVNDAQK